MTRRKKTDAVEAQAKKAGKYASDSRLGNNYGQGAQWRVIIIIRQPHLQTKIKNSKDVSECFHTSDSNATRSISVLCHQ